MSFQSGPGILVHPNESNGQVAHPKTAVLKNTSYGYPKAEKIRTLYLLHTHSNYHRRIYGLLSLLSLALFCAISFGVYAGRFVHTDFTLTVKLQDKMPARLTNELGYLVDIGSSEIMSVLLVIALLAVPLAKRFKIVLFLLYFAGLGVVWVQKTTFHHPAPPFMFQRDSLGMHFPSSYVQIQYSFPSGHTYRSFFVATLIAAGMWYGKRSLLLKGIVSGAVFGIATAIALALVVLGKHWTSDIVGGASLAVLLVFLTCFFSTLFVAKR